MPSKYCWKFGLWQRLWIYQKLSHLTFFSYCSNLKLPCELTQTHMRKVMHTHSPTSSLLHDITHIHPSLYTTHTHTYALINACTDTGLNALFLRHILSHSLIFLLNKSIHTHTFTLCPSLTHSNPVWISIPLLSLSLSLSLIRVCNQFCNLTKIIIGVPNQQPN